MTRHEHHRRIAYLILASMLIASGVWLFYEPSPAAPPKLSAYLSGAGQTGESVNILLFPNATYSMNLTITEPSQIKVNVFGAANDLVIGLSGIPIVESTGRLSGDAYVIDYASKVILDSHEAPFADLDNDRIPDDYRLRHRLTLKQVQAENSRDNRTPLKKYQYFARTGREIDPLRIDTDGDNYEDATEIGIGTDPIDYMDYPVHGFADKPYFFSHNEILSTHWLIAYWTFDTKRMDALEKNPVILLNNTGLEPGPFGMALHLYPKSKGAIANVSSEFGIIENYTMMAWVTTEDTRSRYALFLQTPDLKPAASIDFGSSRPACTATIDNISYRTQSRILRMLADDWSHHIACVRDGLFLILYVDGKEENRIEIPTGNINAGGIARIGVDNETKNQFYHLIDSIAVFNTAFNQSEVEHLFAAMYAGRDFDADGMGDAWEVMFGLSPRIASDALRDDDRDGLINREEYQYFQLTNRQMDPKRADTDSDGFSDLAEKNAGTDPTDPADYPGIPIDKTIDSDADGMPDRWELRFGLPIRVPDADKDDDSDGLTNIQEYQYYTNTDRIISPINPDTNDNSVQDGTEIKKWADPSSNPERSIILNLPGRFLFDIPSGVKIRSAKMIIESEKRVKLHNQNLGARFVGSGSVDISNLLETGCNSRYCRNVIVAESENDLKEPQSAGFNDFEIRYILEPKEIAPVCPQYPCVIPLTARSDGPANITLSLSGIASCDAECLAESSYKCPRDISCRAGGQNLGAGSTPQNRNRISSEKAPEDNPKKYYYLIALLAVPAGIFAALISVILTRRRKGSAIGSSIASPPPRGGKDKEHYVNSARRFIEEAAASGKTPGESGNTLIDIGWPREYVEEAVKRFYQ